MTNPPAADHGVIETGHAAETLDGAAVDAEAVDAETVDAEAVDADEQAEETGGAPRRQARGARDMIISLVVLLIPVAIIVSFVWAKGGNDVVNIDPTAAIASAQAGKAFPVAIPNGLSADWHPVSARYTPDDKTLRIGYVTPSNAGLQLIESASPVDGLLIRELGDNTRPDGVVTAGAKQWSAYQVRNGERALVLAEPGRTIIVIGDADSPELQALAASVS